jgi:hypothetical protein
MRWGIARTVTTIPMARMAQAPKEGNKKWPCSKSCLDGRSFQIDLEPCKAWQPWLKLLPPSHTLSPIRCEYLEAAHTWVLEPPSTSATSSGLSRASASSTQQWSEAEISRQRVRHTDRSRNYEGESKYTQGKGEGRKCKRRKDKRRRELQPSSKLVSRQGYRVPAPYAPNQRVNEAEAQEQQLFLRDTIRDDCVLPP